MDFSRLKCQLNWKKIDTASYVKIFQVSADEGMGINRVNFLRTFSTEKLFQIHACLIRVQIAKHCDITAMFTYSHANTPLSQSEHTY